MEKYKKQGLKGPKKAAFEKTLKEAENYNGDERVDGLDTDRTKENNHEEGIHPLNRKVDALIEDVKKLTNFMNEANIQPSNLTTLMEINNATNRKSFAAAVGGNPEVIIKVV